MTGTGLLKSTLRPDQGAMIFSAKADEPTLLGRWMSGRIEMGRPGENAQAVSSPMGTTHFFVSIQSIRNLIVHGKLQQAQKLAALLPADQMPAELLAVLRPPRFRTRAPRLEARQPCRSKDYRWISQHGQEYVGRWVALHQGQLLADAASLSELAASIDPELAKRVMPLFHRVR